MLLNTVGVRNAPAGPKPRRAPRKPTPIIESATAKSYASALLAGMLVASAARQGKPVPESIWDQISNLPELTVSRTSFAVDGNDVNFAMTLKRTDGMPTRWVRVGTVDRPDQLQTTEERLLQARVDLGGAGNQPPTGPPPNSTASKDEGPGDGKRGKTVISRTGLDSLAVFAATKADAVGVGRISS